MPKQPPPRLPAWVKLTTRAPQPTETTAIIDTMMVNCFKETSGDKVYSTKRPGTIELYTYNGGGASNGQGMTYFLNDLYAMGSNILYRVTSNGGFASASGSAWSLFATAPWKGRGEHAACIFNGQMVILGGISGAGADLNDVWATADGVTWQQMTASAGWSPRDGLKVAVLGNSLYVIGGTNNGVKLNDVWVTQDLVNWTQVTAAAPWSARNRCGVLAFNNGIYVMGGSDVTGFLNDVWYSPDGLTWNQVAVNASWSARDRFGMIVYADKMWLFGGNNGGELASVYNTSDGITWTLVNAAMSIGALADMGICVYANKIWLVCGKTTGFVSTTAVYNTTNGTAFTTATAAYGGPANFRCPTLPFITPFAVSTTLAPTLYMLDGDGLFNGSIYTATLNVSPPATFTIASGGATTDPFKFTDQNLGQYLVFKNTTDAWVLWAGQVQKITSPNYPAKTVPGVVNLDDTVYVMTLDGTIQGSQISNPFAWDAINFITADYSADQAVALEKYGNFIVAFKTTTTQFYYDAGRYPGSPLLPVQNATARVGCVDAGSVCSIGDTIYFMARSGQHTGFYIARFNGFAIEPVSTPDVDRLLHVWMQLGFAINSYTFSVNGHACYFLSFVVNNNPVLAYDTVEKEWFIVKGINDGGFPAWGHATDGKFDYLQSRSIGSVFVPQMSATFDNYAGGIGSFTCTGLLAKVDRGSNRRTFNSALTVVGDRQVISPATTNPLTISYSDDDGVTFSTGRTVDLAKPRARLGRLGSFYRRQYRYQHTQSQPMRLEYIELEVTGD